MHDSNPDTLDQARAWLQDARHIAVLTGAGISAESGVPTFRDAQTGLWARFSPEDLATEQAFRRDPQRVWDWYAERRERLRGVQPNAGHCDLQQAAPGRPPRCTGCGNLVRPAVVWFGEELPQQALDASQQAAQACDLMLVVGTAGAVYPAAGLAHQARHAGARVVVINTAPSELDGIAHAVLRGPSALLLPTLLTDSDPAQRAQ